MPTDLTFRTAADHTLAGTLYAPADLHPQDVHKAVLIAPATGIGRQFYAAFADYLAAHGYGVLVFDFQGIGESRRGALRDCPASLVSWGSQDLPAALEELTRQFPRASSQLVGHSAGGQLLGLMPNAGRLASLLAVASSSGSVANMPLSYRVKAEFFLRVFIPVSNRITGVSRTNLVGMGGPLPQQVGAQWARWCLGRGYVETGFGKEVRQHVYDTLDLPSLWLNASDDAIATRANVADILRVYPRMAPTAERLTLDPGAHGLDRIGHMEFFRRGSRTLWPLALDWLERHQACRPAPDL